MASAMLSHVPARLLSAVALTAVEVVDEIVEAP
jgi:hypothetical protein